MNEVSSLEGKSVLVPRGKKHAKPFSDLVRKYGGVPVEIPLIAFKAVEPTIQMGRTINHLNDYDWIIFTSNVTVEMLLPQISEWSSKFPSVKVATIGKKTKEALHKLGIETHFMPSEYVAETFVKEFRPMISPHTKILIPKGNLAREHIANQLMLAGAMVEELIVYETYFPVEYQEQLVQFLKTEELPIITFTSPSTVDHFMSVVKDHQLYYEVSHCFIACIGPVTQERAIAHGLDIDAVPEEYTVEAMIQAIIKEIEWRNLYE